jgi:hypothetical protein
MRDLEGWYVQMLASRYHHAFLGSFGGEPAFVVETYWAPGDILGRHAGVLPGDHGFHILVAPPTTRIPRFTRRCFQAATELLFQHAAVGRVLAEPHHRNERAHRVFAAVGFRDRGEVALPDKTARLLVCTRESLLEDCADARPYAGANVPPPPTGRTPTAPVSPRGDA